MSTTYGKWEISPMVSFWGPTGVFVGTPVTKTMKTMYEGSVTYVRFWNFWVRLGTTATAPKDYFFHNYESDADKVWGLINAVGGAIPYPSTEEEIWDKVSNVWNWLKKYVDYNEAAYSGLTAGKTWGWPSIEDFAEYYAQHGRLVWVACFSKAHLFATLLGRVLPRWHTLIAQAHHTEPDAKGVPAPPTATHVYVGVYLADRWFYLDPTAVGAGPLPSFQNRKSIGTFTKVDYEHPYDAIAVPLSPFNMVPNLPP